MTSTAGAPLVLVAEDDPDLRALVAVVLVDAGYCAVAVGSGSELLSRAAEQAPQLVVLDVRMPGLSGLEVCGQLRSDPRIADCGVLLVSSCAGEDDVAAGYGAGADDFLPKPFTPRQLLDRVARLLRPARSA
jgi:DNA-binding response OmpR family regulator